MKNTLFTLLFLLFSLSLSAQIGNRILDRATQRVNDRINNRVNQEVDKQVDKAIDTLLKSDSPTSSNDPSTRQSSHDSTITAAADRMRMFGGMMGGEVHTLDTYTFTHDVVMHMSTTKSNGKTDDESDLEMLYPETAEYQATLTEANAESWGIMDFTNKTMITFTESEKKAIAIPLSGFTDYVAAQAQAQAQSTSADTPPSTSASSTTTFRKTGNTKSILGYRCEEYEVVSEDGKMNYWFTKDVKFNSFGFLTMMAQNGQSMGDAMPYGFVMAWTSYSNKSKETQNMLVTKIDKTTKEVKMADYTLMSLGGAIQQQNQPSKN